MKYWEIIARNLKKRGWRLDYVSALDSQGRTIWIADAHRGDGKRYIVHAEEKLMAFLELELLVNGRARRIPFARRALLGLVGRYDSLG